MGDAMGVSLPSQCSERLFLTAILLENWARLALHVVATFKGRSLAGRAPFRCMAIRIIMSMLPGHTVVIVDANATMRVHDRMPAILPAADASSHSPAFAQGTTGPPNHRGARLLRGDRGISSMHEETRPCRWLHPHSARDRGGISARRPRPPASWWSRPPPAFMPACKAALGDQVAPEMLQAQVEVGTRVCRTIASSPQGSDAAAAHRRPRRTRTRDGPERRPPTRGRPGPSSGARGGSVTGPSPSSTRRWPAAS